MSTQGRGGGGGSSGGSSGGRGAGRGRSGRQVEIRKVVKSVRRGRGRGGGRGVAAVSGGGRGRGGRHQQVVRRRGVKMARRRRGAARGRGGSSGEDDIEDKDAKNMFDRIGEKVYKEVEKDAKIYKEALKGKLQEATNRSGERVGTDDPCQLVKEYYDERADAGGERHPCGNATGKKDELERFSDTLGGQCTNEKIEGNKYSTKSGKDCGACAPFRRLFLCDQNLSHMDENKINNTNNLLLEVSLAAKHEGQSITQDYPKYQATYGDSPSQICTMLARSFADIGDIIRGKDLYLDHEPGKQHLEERLERIFENIQKENGDINTLKPEEVREYWWALNRDQVWKAITCKAKEANIYSRIAGDTTIWNDNCGHKDNNVPTNLDYVPQYLRWFEEWSEEFCRKRNIKLKMAKKECRGENGKEKYCSQNGYDCTKRIKKGDSCSRESNCTACSNKCVDYDFWLEKQQNEFKIQKDKYDNEIKTYVNKTPISNSNSNTKKEYYKEFYEELKKSYKSVHDFLKLLNKGSYCKTENAKEDVIDFIKDVEKTFYRSKYCQPCPDCVVVCENKECKENKEDDHCRSKLIKKILESETPIEIEVLYSGKGQGLITEKLSSFCSNPENKNDTNYQNWKCYNKNSEYNKCEMISWLYQDPKEYNLMLSVECFHSWAKNLLIDTIRWEHQLKNCINNTNVTDCTSKCIKNCECYEAWIKQKQKEWPQVKEVLKKKDKNAHNYYDKLKDVFDRFLFQVMFALDQDEKGKWDQFKKDLEKKFEPSKTNTPTGNSQDAIEFLLYHLNDNATTCKDNNTNEACDPSKKVKTNPCGKNPSASNNLVRVKRPAEMMQRYARKQLEKRGGEYNLKGDASKGTYKQGGDPSGFSKEALCKIREIHSNADGSRSPNPCNGKNEKRFNIGEKWKTKDKENRLHSEAYMPPRREHMCTSNLEYLQTNISPLNGAGNGGVDIVNHSFLGDVLLSANHEAKKIIELYKKNNAKNGLNEPKDKETMCRAMKYSFADIGDIIRGRDMWDKENGMVKLRGHLEKIFGHINESLKKTLNGNDKYTGDDPDYKQLREDWWEANRHQVWRAMKCAMKNGNIDKCNGIPIEDYIPQRLRWMTEWAEWYCKVQSQEYEKLEKECEECKNKSKKCEKGNGECAKCTAACKKYGENIKTWKQQWDKIKDKYDKLYKKAIGDTSDTIVTSGGDPKDEKDVVVFLKQLLPQNSAAARNRVIRADGSRATRVTALAPITLYSSAAGYIHQEMGPNVGCMKQEVFCYSKKGKYAFKDPPTLYKEACNCENNKQQPKPKMEEEKKDACKIVEEVLSKTPDKTTGGIDTCNPKDYPNNKPYPGWNCTNETLVSGKGECMPPRRRKLCVRGLTQQGKIKEKEDIRTQFIKCAAIETHFAWERYKKINTGADKELKEGKIPDEFKRQMYYTFGDFRDIFFGTDISSCQYIKGTSNNIKDILNKENEKRQEWWTEHGPEIWEGMLCALTNGLNETEKKNEIKTKYSYDELNKKTNGTTPLEDFAKKPQFLRWFIEWGEDFCKLRQLKVKELEKGCNDYKCENTDETKKEACKKACKAYQEWLQGWKENYKKQKQRYTEVKEETPYTNDNDVNDSTHAYEYLNKKLTNITCTSGTTNVDCNCMKEPSNEPEKTDNITEMPASLEYPPKEINGKCDCTKALPPQQPPQEQESVARSGASRDTQRDHDDDNLEDEEEEEEEESGDEGEEDDSSHEEEEDEDHGANDQDTEEEEEEEEDEDDEEDDDDEDDDDDDDDDEDGDEDEDEEQEEKEEKATKEDTGRGEEPPAPVPELPGPTATTTQNDVKVCETVGDALKLDTLKQACALKYGKTAPTSWKCIPSGTTSGESTKSSGTNQGATCIPPRRRKLYVGKLEEWADKQVANTGESKSQTGGGSESTSEAQTASDSSDQTTSQSDGNPGASTSPPSSNSRADVDLREAFIQSAAIETFFLWDRYKKIKEQEYIEKQRREGELGFLEKNKETAEDPNGPQNQLKKGIIPEEFKRQMFYTLADYKDILFGDKEVIEVLKAGGDKNIDKIEQKIKTVIENSRDTTPPTQLVTPTSDEKRKTLWETFAPQIWNGMVCALTYEDEGARGESAKIKQNSGLKEAFFGKDGKKPKDQKYEYEKVELKDEEQNGAKPTSPGTSGEKTRLSEFVLRPPYFRYLEEWGQNFCKERKKRLEDIKYECRGDRGGHQYCSGDGHDCTDDQRRYNNMFDDLDCRPCYEQCRKYRKWIDIKFEEFKKQENNYKGELQKLSTSSNNGGGGDNKKYYQELKEKNTAADYLKELKHCKNDQNSENKGNQEDELNKLDFTNITQTFSRSTYCKTCPSYVVNCNRGTRGQDPCKVNFNGNEWKKVFDEMSGNSTITVDMIDRREPHMENDLKHLFKTSRLFKAIREQKWTCKFKDKNTDVCKLDQFKDKIDLNQYTTFKVLLIYWLEDFLYGYYILKKRKIIDQCTKNGEKACDKEPKNYCACVKEWIGKKRAEWEKIKKLFIEQYKSEDDFSDNLNSFLETLIPQIAVTDVKNEVIKLSKFDKSKGCCVDANSQKKNDNEKDAIECMINRLTEKITSCLSSTSEETQNTAQCQEYTPPDDDEPLEETEENTEEAKKKMVPTICEGVLPEPQPETGEKGDCKTDPPQPDVKVEEEKKEEEKPKGNEQEESPPPAQAPDLLR
ncbi:hypothetical protein PFTANZ_06690 [Plasmodium falciparum Tanzania (2000708)]|uniref:Duffy-binding-like domain-containing protein n=1 Tax=Plasmodium falciparum Tanzania (2000708) TaxID=1036725 RepID=A0A024VV29_PLAFA|nr:hypothetical protein PFTANZ_06690 [Plasmodium falciparum Tanzania (2000708)]